MLCKYLQIPVQLTMTRISTTRPRLARPATLLLATLLVGLVASDPADARRAGGGRSSGMSRSISVTEAPLRPAAVRGATIQGASAQVGPATASHASMLDIGRESALLIRRANLEAQQQQRLQAANRRIGGSEAAVPVDGGAEALAPVASAPLQVPTAALPTIRALRNNTEPDFNRFTALPVMATACEIKPVMRDDDYIACGANPPESPMGNRR